LAELTIDCKQAKVVGVGKVEFVKGLGLSEEKLLACAGRLS